MAGTFPNTNYSGLNLKSNQRTLTSVADDGTTYTRQIDSQRFSLTLSFPPQSKADFMPIIGFLMKQRSKKESFTLPLPGGIGNARGTAAGSPTGTASAGDTTITLAGIGTGSLLSGDLITFGNHDKVYMVVDDASDISATNTLTIEPPLREAVSGTAISFDNLNMTVRLTSDLQEYAAGTVDKDGNLVFNFELDVIEAL